MSNDNEEKDLSSNRNFGSFSRADRYRDHESWPYIVANFKFWAVAPFWTYIELACVSLGFDPAPFNVCNDDEVQNEPELLAEVSDRVQLAWKAVQVGDLDQKIRPRDGVTWLLATGQEVHEELVLCVENARPIENAIHKEKRPEEIKSILESAGSLKLSDKEIKYTRSKTAVTKEYQSLQKIAIVGAIKGYGLDLSQSRSNKYREISEDAAQLGIDIHKDTVRNLVMKAANDQLPSETD